MERPIPIETALPERRTEMPKMSPVRRSLPLGLLLAGGCAESSPPLHVMPRFESGECRYEAGARTLSLDELAVEARAWRGRAVRFDGGAETPYKCLGGAIFFLQRAGVRRIGFISEPPAAE
jgi:hypothetical protein